MILKINNLKFSTFIGVYEREKKKKRPLIFNLEIHFDGEQASQTDDLEHTLDYDRLLEKISQRMEEGCFNLIEKVARETAEICLGFAKVSKVKVEVEKAGAVKFADSVSIVEVLERKE